MDIENKKNRNINKNKNLKREMQLDFDYYNYTNEITFNKNIDPLIYIDKNIYKFSIPRNVSQEKFVSALTNKNYRIIVASGPAGTGKTLFGIEHGIKNYIEGNYEKLIFTRPIVSVDEDIGYLPGTIEDKMAPWIRPIYDILYNFISPKEVEYLVSEKIIEISPLGFMRGRTFKNCWIVADEMQNSTVSQMKMLLTRIGENSRLIITGDCEQHDRKNDINGLEDFLNKIKGRRSDSISSIEFNNNDIEREDIVKEVLEIYGTNKIPYEVDV